MVTLQGAAAFFDNCLTWVSPDLSLLWSSFNEETPLDNHWSSGPAGLRSQLPFKKTPLDLSLDLGLTDLSSSHHHPKGTNRNSMCPHTTPECALLEIWLCRPCNSRGWWKQPSTHLLPRCECCCTPIKYPSWRSISLLSVCQWGWRWGGVGMHFWPYSMFIEILIVLARTKSSILLLNEKEWGCLWQLGFLDLARL